MWHHAHSYDEPFGWWGPVWAPATTMSIIDLVRGNLLCAEVAALLSEFVARKASIVVTAGPSGAGKTTLLTALLDALPSTTRRVYLRGSFESFDFLEQTDPANTALLVNEISAHLPIYLWGSGVRRVLQAAQTGYQLAATAHATSIEEFVYSLAAYPLRIPATELRAIDLVVLIDAWRDANGIHRAVREVVALSGAGERDQIVPRVIATGMAVDESSADDFVATLKSTSELAFGEAVQQRTLEIERQLNIPLSKPDTAPATSE